MPKTNPNSKQQRIRRYLQSGKSLTPQQAISKFSSYRLAAIVHRLNKLYDMGIKSRIVYLKDSEYAVYQIPQN